MSDIVRVLRIIEYVGTRNWLERTITNSIQGEMRCGGNNVIRAATIGTYPEILKHQEENLPEENPDDSE